MAKIIPFKALRYTEKTQINEVVSPPYDIIPADYQQKLHKQNPYNVIRLEYGEEKNGDNDENNKYTRAHDYLNQWLKEEVLKQDDQPALYVYQQNFALPNGEKKSLTGIVCLVKLEEFSKGVVLPHEETLSKAKQDRFNLMSQTFCNFSQIYSLYIDGNSGIASKIAQAANAPSEVAFTSDEGIEQKLWRITDEKEINEICGRFDDKQLFIADGHHRYETALRFKDSCGARDDCMCDYVMMYLVDMENSGLCVFPTHRLLADLENFNEEDVVNKLANNFSVEKVNIEEDASSQIMQMLEQNTDITTFAMYTGGNYYYKITLTNDSVMREKCADKSAAYCSLDVSVLHTLILDEIFGIDMENMANQKNLTYVKVAKEATDSVESGQQQCAFLLNATKVSQIKDVSLANEKMPQKSTYFWPKLVTGIVMNKFK